MDNIFDKVFITQDGEELGIIREVTQDFPSELTSLNLIAEDECGNYFYEQNNLIYYWEHETSESIIIANSLNEFKTGCIEPSVVELKPSDVENAWIDPEFAKEMGVEPKP